MITNKVILNVIGVVMWNRLDKGDWFCFFWGNFVNLFIFYGGFDFEKGKIFREIEWKV